VYALLNGLNPHTTYYFRLKGTNAAGTVYGTDTSFTTGDTLPIVTTTPVTSILSKTAKSGGTITSDGGSAVTDRGVCWNTTPNPTKSNNRTYDGTGTGSFTSSIFALTQKTKYYVRAFATNTIGTAYGNEETFTTVSSLDELTENGHIRVYSDMDRIFVHVNILQGGTHHLILYDMNGKAILEQSILNNTDVMIEPPLSASQSVYLLRIITSDGRMFTDKNFLINR
jgi:hypothetical protein